MKPPIKRHPRLPPRYSWAWRPPEAPAPVTHVPVEQLAGGEFDEGEHMSTRHERHLRRAAAVREGERIARIARETAAMCRFQDSLAERTAAELAASRDAPGAPEPAETSPPKLDRAAVRRALTVPEYWAAVARFARFRKR